MASDYAGNDVTSSLTATDVTPCLAQESCFGCDITFASKGLCAPGTYLYLYRSGLLPLHERIAVRHMCIVRLVQPRNSSPCSEEVCATQRTHGMFVLCFAKSWCCLCLETKTGRLHCAEQRTRAMTRLQF